MLGAHFYDLVKNFKVALPGLFLTRFSVVGAEVWHKPAFKKDLPLPSWMEPSVVFNFDSPVFVTTKERNRQLVQLI
jgi:hypothetical protein